MIWTNVNAQTTQLTQNQNQSAQTSYLATTGVSTTMVAINVYVTKARVLNFRDNGHLLYIDRYNDRYFQLRQRLFSTG